MNRTKKAAEVDRIFRNNGRARLKWSCSATINRWELEEGIQKLVIWQNWHRLWLYGSPSSVELPSSLLLPEFALVPRSFNVDPKSAHRARSSLDVPESCSEDSDTQCEDQESSSDSDTSSGSEGGLSI